MSKATVMTRNGSASDKATGSNGIPTRSETGTDRTKAKTEEVKVVVAERVRKWQLRSAELLGEGRVFVGMVHHARRKKTQGSTSEAGKERDGTNVSRNQ